MESDNIDGVYGEQEATQKLKAAGYVPAAKGQLFNCGRVGSCPECAPEPCKGHTEGAAKQDGAPAAEQESVIASWIDEKGDHHAVSTSSHELTRGEKTPLQTAARMLRQALVLVETEDDYQTGNTLSELPSPAQEKPVEASVRPEKWTWTLVRDLYVLPGGFSHIAEVHNKEVAALATASSPSVTPEDRSE